MLKKRFIILIMFLLLVGLTGTVLAKDKYTTTSTINGATINWEYELNDSNQIENLICTNPVDLSGNITIPDVLDGKTVIGIGSNAFESATNITSVTLPNSIQSIEYGAFKNCTKLTKIDLGNITTLSYDVFKGCTSLTEITIPKTLKNGSGRPCLNNPNITKIILEDGMTIVPENLCANTGITEITIPSTVTQIENSVFANCTELSTEIIVPSTVTEIGFSAFENCTKLTKIDLGNITKLSFDVFKGCTSLTEITIPKTLKNGSGSPCLNNPNITKIILEEGMTIVPENLCANTGITEITIPSTVTEIGFSAFKNCTKLTKITILDNVKKMGFYNIRDDESVFENHNENLTIYCYKDSIAAKYAIKYDIKYVYLKNSSNLPIEDSKDEEEEINIDNTFTDNTEDIKDNTIATGNIPQTGIKVTMLFLTSSIVVISCIIFYTKCRKFRDIK